EWVNPGGSVKDRPALNIVREAERNGQLYDGRTLLDATSGNTGIAYAMIGAARGFPVELCMPSNVSHERKRMLKAYGAEVVFTDPNDGSDVRFAKQGNSSRKTPRSTSTPTSIRTMLTGEPITTPPPTRSGIRLKEGLPTLWRR